MQITPAAVDIPGRQSDAQPVQVATEQRLFDYLAEMEKSLGQVGSGDPAALIGDGMRSLEGMLDKAQQAFAKVDMWRPGASGSAPTNGAAAPSAGGGESAPSGYDGMVFNLQQAVEVMWATFNTSLAVNSVSAATASANTLIKQQ